MKWPGKASERGSPQLVQQRRRLFEIGGIEALGEPAVDRGEEITCFGAAALFTQRRARLVAARNSQSLASCSSAMLSCISSDLT